MSALIIPKLIFTRSMKAVAKSFREARPNVMKAIGTMWHNKFLPYHFQFIAYSRYGYKPRNKKYEIRKARKMGHRRPLVYTGNVERATKSYTLSATSRSVRVKMTYPNVSMDRNGKQITVPYLSLRGRSGTGPDMKAELTRVAPVEMEQFQDLAADMLTLAMNKATGNPSVADVA